MVALTLTAWQRQAAFLLKTRWPKRQQPRRPGCQKDQGGVHSSCRFLWAALRPSFRARERARPGLGDPCLLTRLDPPLTIEAAAQDGRGFDVLPPEIDRLCHVPTGQARTQCDTRTGDHRRRHRRCDAAEERARDEGGYRAVTVIAGIAVAIASAATGRA